MAIALEKFINKQETKACLVVGDIILDKYIYGSVNRISPEAPIPVVTTEGINYVPGGAANVAGNIRGLQVDVILCGIVGMDLEGDIILKRLEEGKIECACHRSEFRNTTLKTRIVGMNQQLVRVDNENTDWLNMEEEAGLLALIEECLPRVNDVVLSDYSKGVCSGTFCRKIIELCNQSGKRVLVDPKCRDWSKYKGAYLITPNFKEFVEAVGYVVANEEGEISDAGTELMQKYDINRLLVTRSQYGMTIIQKNQKPVTFSAKQQEVYDVSGAGDTVIASLTAGLTLGYSLLDAVELSNYAAGIAVSKPGTYMVRLEDLIEAMEEQGAWFEDKVVGVNEIIRLTKKWKQHGEKVIFTNGCFDILHVGHINYLNQAKRLGSKLIIGLNSDDSVKRLKGDNRPINSQKERALMLAALQCVDAVVVFDEDTPEELLAEICPDLLVKGGDYAIEEIAGRQFAKETVTVPISNGYSTTAMIERIKEK